MIKIQSNGYTAVIMPEKGANCVSLRNEKYDAEILREGDREKNPFLCGMPILYPVNRIENGEFKFEDRIYRFPINEAATNCHLHGELHTMEFEVAEKSSDFVRCVFERPYLDFPHKFRFEITYRLSKEGLTQKIKIMNLSELNMPNFLGMHTTFNVPFLRNSTMEDVRLHADVTSEIERNKQTYLPTGRILPNDEITEKIREGTWMPLKEKISRHYKTTGQGQIEMYDNRKNVTLVYEVDKKFGWRLFYNGNLDGYICLEPMNCMVNCQNIHMESEYTKYDSIAPHSSREYICKIYLKEG